MPNQNPPKGSQAHLPVPLGSAKPISTRPTYVSRRPNLVPLSMLPRTAGPSVESPEPVSVNPLDEKKLYLIFTDPTTNAQLFLSNAVSAQDEELLRSNNIKAIVNACKPRCNDPPLQNIAYLPLVLSDSSDQSLVNAICESHGFINNNLRDGHNVLVHCEAGISRSSSLVIAYLILHHHQLLEALESLVPAVPAVTSWSMITNRILQTAIDYVHKKKPNIVPNIGFILQLNDLANHWDTFIAEKCR